MNPVEVVGKKVAKTVFDLQTPVSTTDTSKVEDVKLQDPQGLELVRHTCAHVLAQAVQELFPGTQVTIGPVIDDGFYYDFFREKPFTIEDFTAIEKRMKEIVESDVPLVREMWPIDKAVEFFHKKGEDFKVELIQDLVKAQGITEVSIYKQGPWLDLCRGPHVPSTKYIGAFKLTSVAGAYWRGDEKNPMLSRIYGTAFLSQDDLDDHLMLIEEAKKRDHRKLGVELDLFSLHADAPASPFFHPNGAIVYGEIQKVLTELNNKYGYEPVITPLIMSDEMWKKSGHYDNYRENMYFTHVDERSFAVKPMNCPGHCLIYKNTRHSYRELPIRMCEFGRVHRHERSGVVQGLFRVRSFVQDDAHVFCTEDQIESEILKILEMIDTFYSLFGFEYRVELSTRPDKYIGTLEVWNKAEKTLADALAKVGREYQLNPGDGAFYGPKIDFHLKDSLGRSFQCGTIQLDFSMPARFDLEYNGSDNTTHTPVMIHRAISGSLERFLGILIEHFGGRFPLWLAPKQVGIFSVTEAANPYAHEVFDELKKAGYRCFIDDSSDKLSAKIKKYQSMKVPYSLILGTKEANDKKLSLRLSNGEQLSGMTLQDFTARLQSEGRPSL
ncbi:MAG: threonine--tRNA ligase [Bdellovibrionota bacterium]